MKSNEEGEVALGKIDLTPLSAKEPVASVGAAYEVEAISEGYLPGMKKVEFSITAPEVLEKTKKGDLTLQRESCADIIRKNAVFTLKDVYYDYNKATLRPESVVQLEKAYDFLIKNPEIKVQLSSHTDSRGSDKYNMDLSQRQAQSWVDYLIKVKGLPADHIVAKGYGETTLVNRCKNGVKCTEEEHQENRRTEIRILEVAKPGVN